jgi:hypothetical protein
MKLKRKEKVSKAFLIGLLEPFHPTLKTGEKIVDLFIRTNQDNTFEFTYVIMGGGVKDSKELRKGD